MGPFRQRTGVAPGPHGPPPYTYRGSVLVGFTSKFTSILTSITSTFADNHGIDCMYFDHCISYNLTWCYSNMHVFFFEVPRIEEVQDPSNSPRREEVGRRTLGAYGGFLLPFFYRARFFSSRHSGSGRIEISQDYSYENL